ncbi:ATP synthase subunit I [Francisella sp. W12-1067]
MLANIKIDFKKFLLVQMLLLFFGCTVTLIFYGWAYSQSFLLGGLIMFLANFVFFVRLFVSKQFSPTIEIMIFFLSEMLKLSIVGVTTILLAIYVKPKLFPYIFGIVLLQLAVCFVPFLLKRVR